ncbi:single-stranded DNA-binding protein mitochondrial isoform X1 [Tripterygium wilfordii]|uniref:Single-stranded DNA-binding protein mitochondrial isoform X1 n=1 Tax=Tripterygium wilfordii TaxID=458696 RepID=A0A7J7CJ45_TRIWF|nr:single-stranded DNA-binding protein, mitochondrial-like [Tripterygium wilfordii]KAF5734085.1 single-stranded DNA-binding protein mitochondrial isoform X1 [Tripterygium wilfordii]
MAGLVGTRLCRYLFSTSPKISQISMPFSTSLSSHEDSDHDKPGLDLDNDAVPDASQQPPPSSSASSPEGSGGKREIYDRPLENGLDVGIYKAIIVGQVGQSPIKKKLRSGRSVALFSVGTGGIRNNRRPLENEDPRDYANRCAVQWHRVSVYPERLGDIAVKHALPGSIIYLEGNLETKIFTDPITGLVRRIREIAIRQNGRLVFLGKGAEDDNQSRSSEFKGVGYY